MILAIIILFICFWPLYYVYVMERTCGISKALWAALFTDGF